MSTYATGKGCLEQKSKRDLHVHNLSDLVLMFRQSETERAQKKTNFSENEETIRWGLQLFVEKISWSHRVFFMLCLKSWRVGISLLDVLNPMRRDAYESNHPLSKLDPDDFPLRWDMDSFPGTVYHLNPPVDHCSWCHKPRTWNSHRNDSKKRPVWTRQAETKKAGQLRRAVEGESAMLDLCPGCLLGCYVPILLCF